MDLTRCTQVCKQWMNILDHEDSLWRQVFQERWPERNLPLALNKPIKLYFKETAIAEAQRIAFEPYKYLLSIMRTTVNSNESLWEHEFTKGVSDDRIVLNNGIIYIDSIVIGKYRFVRLSDGKRKFAPKPALLDEIGCPYIGKTVGYFNFEFNKFNESTTNELWYEQSCAYVIRAIMYESKGLLGRTDTGYVDSAVSLVEYPMKEAFSKFGLEDGKKFFFQFS